MEAGQELDALVAEKVMGYGVKQDEITTGWEVNADGTRGTPCTAIVYRLLDNNGAYINAYGSLIHGYGPVEVPDYSTDIAAAWDVVDTCDDYVLSYLPRTKQHYVSLLCKGNHGSATCDHLPEAICLAALKAVGVKVPE